MKKNIFVSLIAFFIFVIIYLFFGVWGIFEINKHERFLFKSDNKLKFHKKYSQKIHHLRDVDRWGKNTNEYLFSILNQSGSQNKKVLFQGDSWIESISEIKNSEKLLKNYGIKKNYNIYNAGVTSFAPSLMHIQYKILKNDFQITPDILVIYIDQTDIGDEYCRYRSKKVYSSDKKLIYVDRERYNKAVYDYTKLYEYSELRLDGVSKIIFKYPYVKSRYFVKRNIFQIKQIFINGFKNRNINKCSFREIKKELISYNKDAEENFKFALKEYLDFLKKETKIQNVLIVSFPHLKHHNKEYKVNVSNYIDEIIKAQNDARIQHLNMSLMNFNVKNIEKIYKKDFASHLNDEYHTKIFLKNILSKISNF